MAGAPSSFGIMLYGHQLEIAHSSAWNDKFWQRAAGGEWERDTLDFVAGHIGPDTVVLDIGAWIGPITLLAAKRAARVIAVEPDPVARSLLTGVVARNTDNVTIIAAAVGSERGMLTLYAETEFGDSKTTALKAGDETTIEVEMLALRDIVAMAPADTPLFIKMDIEGSEYDLTDELALVVAERQAILHLSIHPRILARSIDMATGIAARWQTFKATADLVAKLKRCGRDTLVGSKAYLPAWAQLFAWIVARRHIRNFSIVIVP